MKELFKKNDYEIICLQKSFYSKKTIKTAIKKYNNFIIFDISQNKNYLKIKIQSTNPQKYTKELLKDEFMNYLIYLEYNNLNKKNELQ